MTIVTNKLVRNIYIHTNKITNEQNGTICARLEGKDKYNYFCNYILPIEPLAST